MSEITNETPPSSWTAKPYLTFRVKGRPVPWQRRQPGGIHLREIDALIKEFGSRTFASMRGVLRQRAGRKGRTEDPTKMWEGQVAMAAASAMCVAGVDLIPKGHRVRIWIDVQTDTEGGDIDNYCKSALDAITGTRSSRPVVFDNDKQVATLIGTITRRVHPDEAGITITVWDMGAT